MKLIVLSVALFSLAAANPVTHLPGGLHPLDVHDANLIEIVAEAETKINAQLNSLYYHKILKIISAQSQVVSGIMYHVSFEMGQTQCLKEKVTKDNLTTCDAFSHIQTCEARIHSQPWMKILDVASLQCSPKASTAHPEEVMTGGLHKIDVHDAELLKTLFDVQPQINDKLNSPYYHRIGKVIEAQSQVVSGVKFHVTFELGQTQCLKEKVTKENLASCDAFTNTQVCKAQIWSQPWLQHIEITEIKCEVHKEAASFYSNEMPGGHHKMDVHDTELLKTLSEVQPQLNDRLNSAYYHRVGKIIDAESQVVSGVMYHVTFELGQTQCLKEKVTKDNLASCDAFTHVQICHAKIWAQPWLHHTEITEVNCQERKPDVPSPHNIPGGKHLIDVDNKEMRAALASVESRMSNQLNSPFVHTVTKVTEASSQVVAGVLYHVSFEFGQTKCMKSHPDLEGCRSVTLNHHCHAEIFVQSWLNNIELHKFHCDN